MDETFDLLTIALLPEVGPRTIRELRARAPLREVIAHPAEHSDLLGSGALRRLCSGEARPAAEAEAHRARQKGFRIVGQDEAEYPGLLRRIYDPPPVLWVRGSLLAEETAVAVVGSRAASVAGCILARTIARDLASAGLTIVSGLARGIDTAAHRGALDAAGRTVAVLGSGLDRLYPAENEGLASTVCAAGALVSEFPLGTLPYPGHFPRRNRLIAGWSRAVVVVEAAARSGALVTARAALEEGRDVLAVPGHPSHPGSAGTNQLIRDGAALARDARDVAAEIGLEMEIEARLREVRPTDPILEALSEEAPVSLEELQERIGRPLPELLMRLTELEMSGQARRLPGSLFIRN